MTSYHKGESFGRALAPSTELNLYSSDRELPRDMFRFKTVWNYHGSISFMTSYHKDESFGRA